jgi:hypothetical protein
MNLQWVNTASNAAEKQISQTIMLEMLPNMPTQYTNRPCSLVLFLSF